MTSGVPWQVDGVRPQARESARQAARRSGMSVGEWLDSVINDRAKHESVETARLFANHDDMDIHQHTPRMRHQYRDDDPHRPAPPDVLAEVRGRLDEVGRQLDQLSGLNATQAYASPNLHDDEPPHDLADAISRLDRRLDRLIATGRSADEEVERRVSAVDQAVAHLDLDGPASAPADPPTPLERALAEIAERQRALDADGGPSATRSTRPDLLPRAPTQGLSSLEQQLRQVTTQIESLRPCGIDKTAETLREGLAEIGLMLKEAMPRRAIEALESEVRGLGERLHLGPQAGGADIAGVEQALAEIRDALRALTPAENLVGVAETVKQLSDRIELIASKTPDAGALEQLEGAIAGLRSIVTHVASDGALAKLSDEVGGLAAKVDQIVNLADSSADLLSTLEHRISSVADALETRGQFGQPMPGDLDAVVKGLADRLEQLGFGRSDQAAVGQLEDRIAKLVDKLDTSNSRLEQLEDIETALAELLVSLERRNQLDAGSGAGPSPEVTLLRRDVQQTQSSLETMQGALGDLVDRLALIENDVHDRGSPAPALDMRGREPAAPAPAALAVSASPTVAFERVAPSATAPAPAPRPAKGAAGAGEHSPATLALHEHRPIDPSLPPDHPLEPGAVRGRSGNSPVDRIAASEAALGPVKPPVIPEPGGKSNFIAAARRAAQAASEAPARGDKRGGAPADAPASESKAPSDWGNRVRSLLVAVSVVLIVLGSLRLITSLFEPSEQPGNVSGLKATQSSSPLEGGRTAVPDAPDINKATPVSPDEPPAPAPVLPPMPSPGRQSLLSPVGGGTSISIPAEGFPGEAVRQLPAAAPVQSTTAVAPEPDITGSAARSIASTPAMSAIRPAPAAQPPAGPSAVDKLPATIGAPLRAAAAKGDPAAEYEIAQRYADGRGVPQNPVEAANWFERAAKQGLVPAQFRLGGFYEKGFGVKKDLEAARRLYTAAAEAGNAKAMHNLAVLYAEGIDGKPDYTTAAKWFRKAADYGITDSQYNLGILHARGIGVEPNLPEAYKWFSLAAREGDNESATKRDDVGSRLDPQRLEAAKLAVQTWKPLEQPEAAAQAFVPAGGWDVVAPAQVNPKPHNPGAKVDLANPPPAR